MKYIKLFFYYLTWHYTSALHDFYALWRTLLWFSLNYFSVRVLIKTIYKPFSHLTESNYIYKKVKEPMFLILVKGFFGFLVRLFTIILGLISWVLIFTFGIVALAVWLALPALIIFFFITGLTAVFQKPLNIQS